MLKIFLASHGKLASGMKSSLDILLGDSNNITVFDAFLDESSLADILNDYLATISTDDTLLLCSDLYGGSVNQVMSLYLSRPNTYLVAGVNLAFMLKLAMLSDVTKEELLSFIDKAKEALCLVELENIEVKEDFF